MKNYLESSFNLDDEGLIAVVDELPLWSAPFGISLLNTIELKKNIKVLDVGFGLGFPLLEVAMRLGNSSKIYGIDPWLTGIKRTKTKMYYYGITNVELIEGVAESIPLEDNSIDLIISNNGINNVADLPKTLRECSRVAKKDAQFVATVNLPGTMLEFYNIFEEILIENKLDKYVFEIKSQIHKKRKPLSELKNLLGLSGFSIVSAEQDSFNINFIDGTAMFRHFLISLAFLDSWKSIVPAEYQKDIFNQLEMRINNIAENAGGFSLAVPFVTIDCRKK